MPKDLDFYYKKNRIAQLRGFCAVMQSGYSITEAAEKTHVERSALSKQISALERDLGTQLFDRSEHKKITPTTEGQLFYEEAVAYMNGIDSLFENFDAKLKQYNDKHLNLALHYTAASYIIPKILGKLLEHEEFKDLEIKIFDITIEEALKKLMKKEVDLAFYPISKGRKIPIEMEVKKNIKKSNVLICGKNHPLANNKIITKEEIEKYDLLIRSENALTDLSKYFNAKPSNITFENAKIETTIELVKYTNTISTLSKIIFDEDNAKLNPDVVKIEVDNLFSESYYHTIRLKNPVEKDSVNFVIEELDKLVFKK